MTSPFFAFTLRGLVLWSCRGVLLVLATAVCVSGQAPAILQQPLDQTPCSIRTVVTGGESSMAIRQDGALWTWGCNANGQLTDGTNSNRYLPIPSTLGSGIVSAAGSVNHNIEVSASGLAYGSGWNAYGQLGDGTTTDRNVAVQVSGVTNVVAAAVGWAHSYFLKSDGTVWAVGYNFHGQLGDGTNVDKATPVKVTGLSNIVAIASGWFHGLAIDKNGTVWAWGYDGYGGLGDGSATDRYVPFAMLNVSNAVSIAAGWGHSVVVEANGTVWTCGENNYGQLGNGGVSAYSPVRASGVTGAIAAAAGCYGTLILKSDGTVWGAGQNGAGAVGDGTTTDRNVFVQTIGLSGVRSISTDGGHGMALKTDGTLWGWGSNENGEDGDGSTVNRLAPEQITAMSYAVFCVVASGSPTPTYQWQRKPAGQTSFSNLTDNATYSGSASSTLRVVGPTSAMSGDQFQCVVTNSYGSVTSVAAKLTVGPPTMTILGGNNQTTAASQFNAQAFDAAVWNAAGTQPLMATPITFTVQSGGGMLATTNSGSPSLYSTVTLNTDNLGTAQVFYKQPSGTGVTSQIVASSGGSQITFTTQTAVPGTPPSAPAWLHAATSTPTSVSFSWGAATGYNGATITGYNVYRNGTLVSGPQLSLTYSDNTVAAGTAYTYTVKAIDSTGAVSTAATLSITAPGSSTSGTFDVYTPAP